MPKGWEQYDDSPFMLKPPTSTVVEQVPDSWDHQMLLLVQGFRSSCLSFRESFIHNSGSFLHAENHPHVPVCCCPGEDWRDGAHAALTLRKNKLYHHGGTALVTWLCDDGWRTLRTYICCAVALSLIQQELTFLKGTKANSWYCQSETMTFSVLMLTWSQSGRRTPPQSQWC